MRQNSSDTATAHKLPTPMTRWLILLGTTLVLGYGWALLYRKRLESAATYADRRESALEIDTVARAVRFGGTLRPARFNSIASWTKSHHMIVAAGGGAERSALIVADPDDVRIQDALESLGGRPGDNLTEESWTRRNDSASTDPDLHVAGTPVAVAIILPDGRRLDPEDLLIDRGGRGYEFRLGGHRVLRDVWRSGCIVCLQSCPGGRVSNARYTMRDLARGLSRFTAIDLPAEVRVTVELRVDPATHHHP